MDEYDQEVGSVRLAASLAAGQPPVRFNHEDHDEEGHDDNDDDHDFNDDEDDYEDYAEFGKLKSIIVATKTQVTLVQTTTDRLTD